MGLFKSLGKLFGQGKQQDDFVLWVPVKCNRCGEIIRTRINLRNDLSIEYGDETTYFCRKIVIGEQMCFQQIEVELTFDANRNLTGRKIKGGTFVEEQPEQARGG